MARNRDFISDIITAVGGKVTPSTRAAVSAWQRKEGGATNNNATFNWLNRTDKGFPTINKVGVVAYPNYQTGIARTAALINSGYPGIANALRSGTVDFGNAQVQADLNRWLSGKREPGWTPYVSSIAKLAGMDVGVGQVASNGGSGTATPTTLPPPAPGPAAVNNIAPNVMGLLGAMAARRSARMAGQRASIAPMIGQLLQLQQAVAPQVGRDVSSSVQSTQAGNPSGDGPVSNGKQLQLPLAGSWKGTHVTDGLGWGTDTAEDIMGAPGTAVLSPADGQIVYFHPTGAQGGGSMLLRAANGIEYWLGHIANGLQPGAVRRGQQIAMISGDHARPHVHIDWRRYQQ